MIVRIFLLEIKLEDTLLNENHDATVAYVEGMKRSAPSGCIFCFDGKEHIRQHSECRMVARYFQRTRCRKGWSNRWPPRLDKTQSLQKIELRFFVVARNSQVVAVTAVVVVVVVVVLTLGFFWKCKNFGRGDFNKLLLLVNKCVIEVCN
jgi:hypothetical protein